MAWIKSRVMLKAFMQPQADHWHSPGLLICPIAELTRSQRLNGRGIDVVSISHDARNHDMVP